MIHKNADGRRDAGQPAEWGIKEPAQNGWEDDGGYIELHKIAKDVVHNRYVDHVDHSAEFSPRHHHHGQGVDILIHDHEAKVDHHHIIYLGNIDSHYGAANHTHKANDPNE